MKILLAGEGAFGVKHLEALANIPEAEVVCLAGGVADATRAVAETFKIPSWTVGLAEGLARRDVEAVILTTPTPLHAQQAELAMRAGKHVLVEIPMADNLADCERLVGVQMETGMVAMAGHTRRFHPSQQYVRRKLLTGELNIQQMDVQTYFFRRTNMNALGKPRRWTDHLLWHHACHTVDLFQYQTGEAASIARGVEGSIHPELKIAMDMSIQMKVPGGAVCTLSLSFNNNGPIGTITRYICDNATYIVRYDALVDGYETPIDLTQVDVSMNGVELQDREFIAAIRQGREPNASLSQCLPAMRTLDVIEKSFL